MRQAKTTLLDVEKRKQYDKMRINHYKSLGEDKYINRTPDTENVIDQVKKREYFIQGLNEDYGTCILYCYLRWNWYILYILDRIRNYIVGIKH